MRERLAWFIRLRWWAAGGIVAGGAGICAWTGTIRAAPVCAVGLGVGLYNGLFIALYRHLRRQGVGVDAYRRFAFLQMGADWLALVVLLCLSGGIQSALAPAFGFHLIIGALLLSGRACYALAGIGTGVLGALAALEIFGLSAPTLLPTQTVWEASGTAAILLRWGALGGAFYVMTYLTASIAERLREKELELNALHEEKVWFMRTTTHQLRAPLATIQGLLEALPFAGPLSDKQSGLIDRCIARIQEPLYLIHDLLELSSAQRLPAEQKPEHVALLECLEGVLETARARAETKGVRFEIEARGAPAVVFAQPEDMRRIFSNLLDNAVKYTPAGGQVTFSVEMQSSGLNATICDTGIGIGKEDQEKIYDEFFRTEGAKATGEMGTGLGLSIVKQLVTRWGGQLRLESEPGKGSRFEVWLPAQGRDARHNL